MKIKTKRYGRDYEAKWNPAPEIRCPRCGIQAVYVEEGVEDFYLGPTYLCASCSHEFSYQDHGYAEHNWNPYMKDIFEHLKKEDS